MFRVITIIVLVSITSVQLIAQSDTLISKDCSVKFTIRNAGLNVEGTFSQPQGKIHFDPKNLSTSIASASVDVSTISTGIGARDKHLQGREYFEAKRFPKIQMKSKTFTQSSGNKFIGTFDLTIRDITKEVKIPFTFTKKGGRRIMKGDFNINRLDYQIGEESIILSDDVAIELVIVSME
jgi:polyisoprenoid-binding protein YceI